MTGRERILSMFKGKEVDRLGLMPITMMFAASQVGKPYGKYAIDHRVLVEAQLATADRFGFDHVSGITETREAPDCGAKIQIFEDQPYAIDESQSRLIDKTALASLEMPDPLGGNLMHDRIQGLSQLKEQVGSERIVEGWVEGACGAGADLRGINRLMLDFYDDPQFVRDLFEFVVELGLRFGRAQIEAGADLLGVGDPAASLVGPQIYREFVWPYEKKLIDGLHEAGGAVRLHICGNTRDILPDMGQLGCEIVDIDSMVSMVEAREAMGPDQILAGGVDPVAVLQNGSPERVQEAVSECHNAAGPHYIVAAGCEVPPDTPEANMRAMAEYARLTAGD
jgi:MtaA/CmuA family methyltransferase